MRHFYSETEVDQDGALGQKIVRIIDHCEGFAIVKGGSRNAKGKLYQYEMMAYCETKEEADTLMEGLLKL